MGSPAPTLLRLNDRAIDVQRGTVVDASGHTATLRPQAAEVLKVLASRPGVLVSKDDLVKAVWGGIAVTDDSLVQCITDIRKALGDEKHTIIRTVLKRGYVLEAGEPQPVRAPSLRRWSGVVATATGLMVIAGAYFLLMPATKSGAELPAVAVLPFENINGDEKWERFANGITEDIITDLARFREIPVIARTSTEVYRDKAQDVREIGKALKVKYVLEGSLQVDGYRMRVTSQLINAETGAHVWSARYDRPAAELLDVQDEITQRIAATLTGWQGQMTEAERAIARRKNAADLNAYDYWLLGIEAKHRMTPASQIEARDYFGKGLKLAPDFMPLVRDMAVTYAADWEIGADVDYTAWVEAHRDYSEKAISLDPNDAYANYQMALAYDNVGNAEQAKRHYELALQLAPNNSDISMFMAWSWGGWQTERAVEAVERTLKLNPRYPSWWNFPIAQTYFAARRFDDAYAAAKQLGESPNQAAFLAMSAAQLGKQQEAAEAAAKVLRIRQDWTAESMFPYQKFEDETLLPDSAAKAGLPVCMTPAQAATFSGAYRLKQCDEARTKAVTSN